jgi:hypothetical protein
MTRTRIVGAFVISLLAIALAAQEKSSPESKFVLSSPDAQLAAKVPEVYTANVFGCNGGNMSPPLQWTGAPAGTKSFVVTLFDPDEHGDHSILTSMAIPRDGGTGSFMTCPRALTNFPRAPARSIAPFYHLEPCRAEPISATTPITDPAPTREILHIAIPSPYMR